MFRGDLAKVRAELEPWEKQLIEHKGKLDVASTESKLLNEKVRLEIQLRAFFFLVKHSQLQAMLLDKGDIFLARHHYFFHSCPETLVYRMKYPTIMNSAIDTYWLLHQTTFQYFSFVASFTLVFVC